MSTKRLCVAVALIVFAVPAAWASPVQQDEAKQDSTKQDSAKVEAWQTEFDQVCSKTTDAMTLTSDELKALVNRCDVLAPKIEKLDETRRKVYSRRLKQCRGLYAYVLDSKNVDTKGNDKK